MSGRPLSSSSRAATLPYRSRASPVRPCAQTMTRSTSASSAIARMACALRDATDDPRPDPDRLVDEPISRVRRGSARLRAGSAPSAATRPRDPPPMAADVAASQAPARRARGSSRRHARARAPWRAAGRTRRVASSRAARGCRRRRRSPIRGPSAAYAGTTSTELWVRATTIRAVLLSTHPVSPPSPWLESTTRSTCCALAKLMICSAGRPSEQLDRVDVSSLALRSRSILRELALSLRPSHLPVHRIVVVARRAREGRSLNDTEERHARGPRPAPPQPPTAGHTRPAPIHPAARARGGW